MRKFVFLLILIVGMLAGLVRITMAGPITKASDTVEVKVTVEDYCEVVFDRQDEPDMEISLRNKPGARGLGRKKVWVAANFPHNIETMVFDQPDDNITLEKVRGTTADRVSVSPGGHNYNVLLRAINEGQRETGVFTAGAVMVTVTKAF